MSHLTQSGQTVLAEIGNYLAESYRHAADSSHEDAMEVWREEKRSILSHDAINWWTEGTCRIIAGFGRTGGGEWLAEDGLPVVGKFEPWLVEMTDIQNQSSNYHEEHTYSLACNRDDDDLFARILAADDDWYWVAMEECVPVFPSAPGPNEYGQEYVVDRKRFREFTKRFKERGWYEHDFDNGNIGVDVTGQTVLIDYGSFTVRDD